MNYLLYLNLLISNIYCHNSFAIKNDCLPNVHNVMFARAANGEALIAQKLSKIDTTLFIKEIITADLIAIQTGELFRKTFNPIHLLNNKELMERIFLNYPEALKLPTKVKQMEFLGLEAFVAEWERAYKLLGGEISQSWQKKSNQKKFYQQFILAMAYSHHLDHGIEKLDPSQLLFNTIENNHLSLLPDVTIILKYFDSLSGFNRLYLNFLKSKIGLRRPKVKADLNIFQEILVKSFIGERVEAVAPNKNYPLQRARDNVALYSEIKLHFGNLGTYNYYREILWVQMGGSAHLRPQATISKENLLVEILQFLDSTPKTDRAFLNWNDIKQIGIDKNEIAAHFGFLERLNHILYQQGIITLKGAKGPVTQTGPHLVSPLISPVQSEILTHSLKIIGKQNYQDNYLALLVTPDSYGNIQNSFEPIESSFGSFKIFMQILNDHLLRPFRLSQGVDSWIVEYYLQVALKEIVDTYPESYLPKFSGFQIDDPDSKFFITSSNLLFTRSSLDLAQFNQLVVNGLRRL